jgi:hypothetical protein
MSRTSRRYVLQSRSPDQVGGFSTLCHILLFLGRCSGVAAGWVYTCPPANPWLILFDTNSLPSVDLSIITPSSLLHHNTDVLSISEVEVAASSSNPRFEFPHPTFSLSRLAPSLFSLLSYSNVLSALCSLHISTNTLLRFMLAQLFVVHVRLLRYFENRLAGKIINQLPLYPQWKYLLRVLMFAHIQC